MDGATEVRKRPREADHEIAHEAELLVAQQSNALNGTGEDIDASTHPTKKRRRHEFAAMTQYSSSIGTQYEGINTEYIEESPSGYIKKIKLRNFMCHENFEMEFGPRLNFIVGNNGSGKSAVLTAITIGLGAKASDTNRGNSLKDLIREGCNSTKITIVLENSKYGSYNQGEFGSEIIIERTIKKDGVSHFSLRAESGKEISFKRKDMQTIIDYFSVPVSNPMCFLSQDAARSFLAASSPVEKYGHFMKGTLLQDINDNLDRAREITKTVQEKMTTHLDSLNGLKEEYEDAKSLLNELGQTSNFTERKKLLQGKSLWIDIKFNKKNCDKLKGESLAYKKKMKAIEDKRKVKTDKMERYDNDKLAMEKEIENQTKLVSEKDSIHQQAKDSLRKVRLKYDEEKRNQSEAEKNIEQCKEKIKVLDKNILHLEQQLQKEMGGDKDQMGVDLKKYESENEKLVATVDILTVQLQDLQNEESNIIQEAKTEINSLENSIREKQNELKGISAGNNNFLHNFDHRLPQLLHLIERRSNEFSRKPFGPLGSYVTVKSEYEKDWTRAIQRYLSSSLNAFIVSTLEDNELLRRMFKEVGIRNDIRIFTYPKLEALDYSYGKAKSKFPVLVDAIEFSNLGVQSLFIDQHKIEKVILIPNHNEAKSYLDRKPINVNLALSLRNETSGYQLVGGFRLDTVDYQNKLQIKVGSSSKNEETYLKEFIKQETNELNAKKQRYQERMSEVRNKLRSVVDESSEARLQLKQNSKHITDLKVNMNKVVDTGALISKQTDKDNQKKAIIAYENSIQQIRNNLDQITEEAQPLKVNFDETLNDLTASQKSLKEAKEEVINRESLMEKYQYDLKIYSEKIKSYTDIIKKIDENVQSLEEGIEKQVITASEFCTPERVNDPDLPSTQEEIKEELEKITRMIKKAENKAGFTQQQAIELFEKSRDKYRESQEKYLAIDKTLEVLYKSIQIRVQNLQTAQKATCLDADLDFRASLRVRNLSGNLSFNTKSKRLEIYILTSNGGKPRTIDNLSGGEKSFAQMALLLATWKPMRSRIIALDEFDVFMDQVNRKIGTGLLVKKLKNQTRTQTIIITPQDIGKISDIDSAGVNIHKMKDPERQNNSNFYG
ncbi:hypothetical protein TPHA_0B00840 [Tetrapisispora phaffii CBS 4417]|uniref:Rad50/SbcC-type AAA domain-containing protein n=1 Tax=Tetrapisispora phaffii (strain ATCC 24235 / CBS 4417 / NBRC 1672 / NRRL Y-8282 / UCD 70-5) TaxID=1071381 RepID=G8BQF9_TETPH|nr:hypothetical protein TPHA_0B00840 [Tetrapisispora phaffii CBS 4417]CCE61756.1 hypothetical protein TPHA_0B00840 [Tetrapisispora phaffii CBS 4417]